MLHIFCSFFFFDSGWNCQNNAGLHNPWHCQCSGIKAGGQAPAVTSPKESCRWQDAGGKHGSSPLGYKGPVSHATCPVCSVVGGHSWVFYCSSNNMVAAPWAVVTYWVAWALCRVLQRHRSCWIVASALKTALSFQLLSPFPGFMEYTLKEDIKGCSATKLGLHFFYCVNEEGNQK